MASHRAGRVAVRTTSRRSRSASLLLLGIALVALWAWPDRADAAAVKATIKKDVLSVTGTSGPDAVTLRLQGGDPNTIEIDVGGDGTADFRFNRQRFTAITVDGGAGDDVLMVDRINGSFTDTELTTLNGDDGNDKLLGEAGAERLNGGAGDDFVDGNQGADTIALGDGADVVAWDPGDGSDTITGGAGTDRLAFNGSNASENLELAAVGGHVRLTRDIAAITMDLDDVEVADLRAFGGADTIRVNNLAGTDLTELRADLAPFGGGDDAQIDSVVVNGTAGDDTVAVGAEASTVVVQGLPTTVRISGAAPTSDRLNVNGLEGNDTITANPEAAALIVLDLQP